MLSSLPPPTPAPPQLSDRGRGALREEKWFMFMTESFLEKNGNWVCWKPSPYKVNFLHLQLTWLKKYKSTFTQETSIFPESMDGDTCHRGAKDEGTQLSNLWASPLLFSAWRQPGVHTLRRRFSRGGQLIPAKISTDVNLLCLLFKNLIQIDIKIDPRTISKLCDLLRSPFRKSSLVTRTLGICCTQCTCKKHNSKLIIHCMFTVGQAQLGVQSLSLNLPTPTL